ncbi:hypothetical protein TrLO_g1131 [Triparma laevis f. longispina]|uniref:Carrier domain-containing protein n=1 Tax=Triparma laevis f. longispina TaxID=1714387 RepID=A0A9W7F323_9STRA|nr:hypothetical protein TrLO_g1131 [Triparma laevis f. longispina]
MVKVKGIPTPPQKIKSSMFFSHYQISEDTVAKLPQQITLIAFPPSGASTSFFSSMVPALFNLGVQTVGVNTPTKSAFADANAMKELYPYETDLGDAVDRYFDDLVSAFIETDMANSYPYAVLGHSAGCMNAKAFVDRLKARGVVSPIMVFFSGSNAPSSSHQKFDPTTTDAQLLSSLKAWNSGEDVEVNLKDLRDDLEWSNTCCEKFVDTCDVKSVVSWGSEDLDAAVTKDGLDQWKNLLVNSETSYISKPGGHHYLRSHATFFAETLDGELKKLSVEGGKIVAGWNSKVQMEWPEEATLHQQFVEQAKRTPDNVAVIDGDKELTYRELDELSTLVAQHLYHKCGVRVGDSTGIFMERCWQFLVCYIGALKAGGAYMPLEVVYPKDLLTRVLESSTPKCVLTKKAFKSKIMKEQSTFSLDDDGSWIDSLKNAGLPKLPEDTGATPESMAYIVMSSGTTGTPKGICCPHRGAVHSYWYRRNFDPSGPDDVEACNVFFVWECLRPLLIGYKMLVIPDEVVYDPMGLVDLLEKHKVTRMLFTPSLLAHTLSSLDDEVLKTKLRLFNYVNLCGEVVTRKLAETFNTLFPDCKLVNLYSISECHDAAQSVLCGPNNELYGPSRSPKYACAGKVIPNVCLHVLDNKQKECPIGVFGEVYVSGPTVAIGYLNKPEQTAERFPPNPFQSTTEPNNTRIYRTGDRGRFLPDGQLEVAGRIAFFVKIRGYSVVPSAIESTLADHKDIATAVVLAIGDIADFDKKLVAYVLPKRWEVVPTQKELKEYCKQNLPPYAVPNIFVPLQALPVSEGTGKKLDTKKLPGWDESNKLVAEMEKELKSRGAGGDNRGGDDATFVLTPNESAVAKIWQQVCGLEDGDVAGKLAPTDTFYDAGGSSLKLAEVAKLMSEATGRDIRIKEIVADPSLAAMGVVFSDPSQRIVAEIWRTVVGISADDVSSEINSGDTFYDIGGSSLQLAEVAKLMTEEAGGVEIKIKEIVADPSLAAMGKLLQDATEGKITRRTRRAESIIDLKSEAYLDSSIYPAPTRRAVSRYRTASARFLPRRVFLTGGTGFLGAHLLYELVVVRQMQTYALVRAKTAEDAITRLIGVLKYYNLIDENDDPESTSGCSPELDLFMDLCVPVLGDLNSPMLGMEGTRFELISGEVDSIIHCGADVNLSKSYADLKKTNVLGTQEVLRMGVTNGISGDLGMSFAHVKSVYYISSNGIFPTNYKGDRLESADLSKDEIWLSYHDGYGKTKWVSEQMVSEVQSRGLPCTILRPGNMSAGKNGAWNKNDFYVLFIRACIELKAAPEKEELDKLGWEMDLTPVDWAAEAIVTAVLTPSMTLGKIMHIQNHRPAIKMSQVISMLETMGFAFDSRVSIEEWRKVCSSGSSKNDTLAAVTVAFESFALYFGVEGKFDCENLMRIVEKGKVEGCPEIDAAYLRKALEWIGVEVP